jgi:hypothetical protein
MTCQNLQNKLLNITVLFIWYLLASLKKMSLAKHGELFFILAGNSYSPLAILASVWKKWFPTLLCLWLWYFTPLSTIFQLYYGGQLFLAHLAKGNVSFCHHLAPVVRRR